ncbi:ribonuclease [Mesotoga sp. UBA5557]|uniref:ribonuclease n=1 Tax=Mesotoga sp. UBA5557 TaxID=1946857 RepID=UPI0025F0CD90|nr:ribonuclease [Mesotoga sp. UBA5557]
MSKTYLWLKAVVEWRIVMITDVLGRLKQSASSQGFYTYYSKRKEHIERLSSHLKKNPVSSAAIAKVRKRIPDLSSLSYEEMEFSIDILRERDKSPEERVDYVSSLSEASLASIGHLLFLIDPRNNPPVTGPIIKEIKSVDDYKEWLSFCKSIGRHGIQNFVMLEAALLYERDDLAQKPDLAYRVGQAVYTNITELELLRGAISNLSRQERRGLANLKFTHPYVKTVLLSSHARSVVVDGSNIVFSKSDHADLNRIDDLFLRMSFCRIALFPYRIVFDANIRYTLGGFQQESLNRLLSLPQVETYSPADDRIIFLARENNSVVVTYDRFLDHLVDDIKIVRPEDIHESLRL